MQMGFSGEKIAHTAGLGLSRCVWVSGSSQATKVKIKTSDTEKMISNIVLLLPFFDEFLILFDYPLSDFFRLPFGKQMENRSFHIGKD